MTLIQSVYPAIGQCNAYVYELMLCLVPLFCFVRLWLLYSVLYLGAWFVFSFYWFIGGLLEYMYKVFLANNLNLLTCSLELNPTVNPGVQVIVSYYVLQFIQNL